MPAFSQALAHVERHLINAAFAAVAPAVRLAWGQRGFRQQGIRVLRNVVYGPSQKAHHRLDIFAPKQTAGGLPVVMHVHGGGFSLASKDTHVLMAAPFAAAGCLVFNLNYRLAPKYPYPAALEDVARAYAFVLEQAPRLGGDVSRLVLTGESAGANLAAALSLMACTKRPEPFAQAVFATERVPRACLLACGLLQVSDAMRFVRKKAHLPRFIDSRLRTIERWYLGPLVATQRAPLADPLCLFEAAPCLLRPLPEFFLGVGTRDPVLDDTRRMQAALTALGAAPTTRYYEGGVHAFHALVSSKLGRQMWADMLDFVRPLQIERQAAAFAAVGARQPAAP